MDTNNTNLENNIEQIENSEEFKNSLSENQESTSNYKNKIASKISNLSTIILAVGIIIGVLGGLSIVALTEGFTIIPTAITIVIISFVSSLLLEGLSEIIELLQSIKDK